MYVTAASLNCRSEPSASATVLRKLTHASAITVDKSQSDWASTSSDGASCWVASRFLSESAPAAYDPAAPPAPIPRDVLTLVDNGLSCGSKRKCGQMDSCEEAYHYLNECGVGRLDGDGDGVPCESIF